MGRVNVLVLWLAVCMASGVGSLAQAQENEKLERMVSRAIEYLKTRGQDSEGAVSPKIGIGVTALAATAMLDNGVAINDPSLAKALQLVAASSREDGGIYAENSRLMMYETCVAMLYLEKANQQGEYDAILKKASAYLRGEQFQEADGKTPSDLDYGGAGYGGKTRPDLSNTAYFIEALSAMGDPANDEAIARALLFVSRCQNLESELNTSPDAAKINDGGFYYSVVGGGTSAAGIDQLTDAAGVQHDWREELIDHLASLQAADGSWTNSSSRWMEGDPNLATTFCLLALSHCRTQPPEAD